MRIDLVLQNHDLFALDACRSASLFEAMGYDGLWLTDHVIGVKSYEPVYGGYWLEILSTLAYLAGTTKKVRLGTGVLVLPYRNPVLTAKMISTIDHLSNGRVDLGVGTGWARSEFNALGVGERHEGRGRVTDETIDLMLRCWRGGETQWSGDLLKFRRIEFEPAPMQKPRVPLWIGARGLGRAPLRRAAKYADVWHPTGISAAEVKSGGDSIDELAGRQVPRSIRRNWPAATPASQIVDELAPYREAGCFQCTVDLKASSYPEYAAAAERFIAAAVPLRH